jgi:hypothetical protein
VRASSASRSMGASFLDGERKRHIIPEQQAF